jgi:UTP--glucose-1-phosphate uridylyltransferase
MRLGSRIMTSTRAFQTAIVPAAGLGTRFLPTTKAVPKELLPVVDTPGIELVAAEAAEAGARRLVIVTSPGKDAVIQYFRPQPELERRWRNGARPTWPPRCAGRPS